MITAGEFEKHSALCRRQRTGTTAPGATCCRLCPPRWGLDVCPSEVPVRLSSGIPKKDNRGSFWDVGGPYVFAYFLSSFEAAALEPRINPSSDLSPKADVRTHQCIDLGMIQFPPRSRRAS